MEAERLRLRPLHVSDVDALVALHADPRVNRFVGACSHRQTVERLTAIERQWAEQGHRLCAVELRSSGDYIGRSGLRYWEQSDEVELGRTIRAGHWGCVCHQGRSGMACLEWGFARLDGAYFTALMRPDNEASVRVAERLGFSPRREDRPHGKPVTVYAVDRPADFRRERRSSVSVSIRQAYDTQGATMPAPGHSIIPRAARQAGAGARRSGRCGTGVTFRTPSLATGAVRGCGCAVRRVRR
ncbi:GNAT family N-acetyltransferase [Streptomyces sp. NPDC045470]|uniref:GNAT family N-acetyltransferase n=1 Tax=Streptomyces sp. NPDC045470 TaxID=3155469 RepID=UPI00340D77AC